MRTALLLRQTRMHFPRLDVDQIEIRPIEKGGSDRKFYRIQCGSDSAAAGLVLVKCNLEREENRHYVQIAQFLDRQRIRVPKIYFHDLRKASSGSKTWASATFTVTNTRAGSCAAHSTNQRSTKL